METSILYIVRGIWKRRKWWIVVMILVGTAATTGLAISLPDIYRATATVLINRDGQGSGSASDTGDVQNSLDSISAQVLSRDRLGRLIDEFHLYRNLRQDTSSQALIERMRSDIRVERKETSRQVWGQNPVFAFTVSYQGWDPSVVRNVTNALVSSYVNESNRIHASQQNHALVSLSGQIENIKNKLDNIQSRIDKFKKRHIGELPEQQQANLATLSQLNVQLHEADQDELNATKRRDDILKQMAASGDATVSQLKQKLAYLRTKYTDNYPDIVSLRAQLKAAEKNSRDHSDPVMSPLQKQYSDLGKQIRGYHNKEDRIQRQIDDYQKRIADVPIFQAELDKLNQGYSETKEIYSSLVKRYERAKLAKDDPSDPGSQYQVLEKADVPAAPAGPGRVRILVMGIFLSITLSAAIAAVLDQLDTSFHSESELRSFTNVPILAGIPDIRTKGDMVKQGFRFCITALFACAIILLIGLGARIVGHGNEQLVWLLMRHK